MNLNLGQVCFLVGHENCSLPAGYRPTSIVLFFHEIILHNIQLARLVSVLAIKTN